MAGNTVDLFGAAGAKKTLDLMEETRVGVLRQAEEAQGKLADTMRDTAQGTATAIAQAAAMAGRKTTDVPDNIPLDSTDLYVMLDPGSAGEVWKRDAANTPATRRREFEAVGSGQLEDVAKTAANLKTGAVNALAAVAPVKPADIASAGNSNYRYVDTATTLSVNLDQATALVIPEYPTSYIISSASGEFNPALVGKEVVSDAFPPGTTVVRYNDATNMWVSAPATRKGAATLTFRHQRWGDRSVPVTVPGMTGAWELEPQGDNRNRVYAWDFGFRPGNDRAANRDSLRRAINYGYLHGIYVVVLPPGDCACAPGVQVSSNMSIIGEGQCRIDLYGNGEEPLFDIGESITRTWDQRGAAFVNNAISRIEGIIFFSSSGKDGCAYSIGNDGAHVDATAGSAYKLVRCGFSNLRLGGLYRDNNWCIDVMHSFFWDNDCHIKHIGTRNSGENLTFTNTHFAQCTSWAVRLEGQGAGFVFSRCSMDYNKAGVSFGNTQGYTVRFIGSWIEFNNEAHFFGADDGAELPFTAIYLEQTVFATTAENAGHIANHTLGPVPIVIRECSIWRTYNGKRQLNHQGPRIVVVPEGQDRLNVPMEWVSEASPPRVTALSQPGGWWWVECPPAQAGVGHDAFMLALQNKAPVGGARFSVDY